MAVPDEIRHLLSQWCAARVPDSARELRQIAYTTQGDEITILDRRPPLYPELDTAWSATPIAQLRLAESESERWTLYLREGDDRWVRDAGASGAPAELLDRLLT